MLLVGCGLETKTLPDFYDNNLGGISKVVIVDGSTGYKKTFSEKAVIDDFLSQVKDIKFIPEKNQEAREGWRYSITLYEDGKEPFQFGLSKIADNYYYTEPDILPIVDDFYKKLDVLEE